MMAFACSRLMQDSRDPKLTRSNTRSKPMHQRFRQRLCLALSLLSAAIVVGCASGPTGQPGRKIRVTKIDDLPRHTYPISGRVSDLLHSRERISELAAKIRADLENDLASYEIADASTLQRMYGTLLAIDLIQEDEEAALERIERIRALEDKEAAKLTTGLTTQAMIAARRQVGPDADQADYRRAFRRDLSERVARLPWKVVQDDIEHSKGGMEMLSENLLMGIVQAAIEPVVAKTGELKGDQAARVLNMYVTLTRRLPLKQEIIASYQEYIDANQAAKPDIWADRSVTLSPDGNYTPVLVGVWDSGTDCDVFKERLFVNPAEKLDGRDDDGNGFIDDVHGIAFDIHARRTTGLLCPLGDAADRAPRIMNQLKGFMDLQAAVDSPECSALRQKLAGLKPADVKGFIEDLSLVGNYAHGTHVAGIITAGNPFAKLLIARLSYDYRMIPVARTVEWGRRDAAKCRDTVEYFKAHGVRVVNMSWGETREDAETSLERNGIGADAEERREIARKVFALQREGLYDAIKNAPDILFVCAAGNADNDVEFDEYIPSSFDLPNLLTVGAVDQSGAPTSFTSFGRTVQVYANGFEVESYVPGGARMKMSGTSMASPNAANLAAKLLAVDPTLTPPQVIDLIKKGADRRTEGGRSFLLMNPKRTLELLRPGL
jgi:hypothetical protein